MKKVCTILLVMCIFMSNLVISTAEDQHEVKIVKVAASEKNGFAIDTSNNLWVWGSNLDGYLGTAKEYLTPTIIMRDIIDIAVPVGSNFLAITVDGDLLSWGENLNGNGYLGTGDGEPVKNPTVIMNDVKVIDTCSTNVGAIKNDGSLWMWGINTYGGTVDGTEEIRKSPVKVHDNVKDVSVSMFNPFLLTEDNELYVGVAEADQKGKEWKFLHSNVKAIGDNLFIDFNDNLYEYSGFTGQFTLMGENVASNTDNAYFITNDNVLYGWMQVRSSLHTQLIADETNITPEGKVLGVTDMAYTNNRIAINDTGEVYSWGENGNGQLGIGNKVSTSDPTQVIFDPSRVSLLTEREVLSAAHDFSNIDYTNKGYIRVNINSNDVEFDVKPQVIDGRTLVPIRAIFETLGLEVSWDGTTQTATGKSPTDTIDFVINSKTAYVNGVAKELDVPAMIIDGRTLVPLRFLSESLGYKVLWIGESKLILLCKGNIIQWKHGGYEAAYPFKEYERKFVNGEITSDTRYTGQMKPYYGDPILFTSQTVEFNSIGTPEAHYEAINMSGKDIDDFEVDIYCYDNYDRPVEHYLHDTNKFGGISQGLFLDGETKNNSYWTLYGHDNTTKIKIVLRSVHYVDGTVWENN